MGPVSTARTEFGGRLGSTITERGGRLRFDRPTVVSGMTGYALVLADMAIIPVSGCGRVEVRLPPGEESSVVKGRRASRSGLSPVVEVWLSR